MAASPPRDWNPSAEPNPSTPFACEYVTLSRQEHIQLVWEARQWKRLHQGAVRRIEELQGEHRRQLQYQTERAEERGRSLVGDLEDARGRIPALEPRVFGRRTWQQ